MLKKFFAISLPSHGTQGNGSGGSGTAAIEPAAQPQPEVKEPARPAPAPPPPPAVWHEPSSFDDIYRTAAVKPPKLAYGILKVADMAGSPHLAGMSAEAKRASLWMALDAAGAEIEDLLHDAVVRQRALNDYEEAQQERLKEFESEIGEQNARVQAELDRITADYMARMQANLNEVARRQDEFRAWQKRKQQEWQRITAAASLCVPQTGIQSGINLAGLLERAATAR